jgi:hypothetical protein
MYTTQRWLKFREELEGDGRRWEERRWVIKFQGNNCRQERYKCSVKLIRVPSRSMFVTSGLIYVSPLSRPLAAHPFRSSPARAFVTEAPEGCGRTLSSACAASPFTFLSSPFPSLFLSFSSPFPLLVLSLSSPCPLVIRGAYVVNVFPAPRTRYSVCLAQDRGIRSA